MSDLINRRSSPKISLEEGKEVCIGDWFWVKFDDGNKEIGCCTHIGSNYVKITFIDDGTTRILNDEFFDHCEAVDDANSIIQQGIDRRQKHVNGLMQQVKELTMRLGVGINPNLTDGSETNALAIRSTEPTSKYKKDLIQAKDKDLPKLFEEISEVQKELVKWMSASLIPTRAQIRGMKGTIDAVEKRIFSVEIYAGLTEQVVQISDGEPASISDKIHLLQRRAYMDEECLANYEAGGMNHQNIESFDKWLARSDNFTRLLPFPRSVLAIQVRRKDAEYEISSIREYIRVLDMLEADKQTFIYIRNGEQLFRISTAIDLGQKLFPDLENQVMNHSKIYARMFTNQVDELITGDQYEEILREEAEIKKWEKWAKKNLSSSEQFFQRPHIRGYGSNCYQEFSPNSVYFDDIKKYIQSEMERHNRLVLMLQGLLDRSLVFHPHPPWQLWTNEGFSSGLQLVYDESRSLVSGEKPDFLAYQKRLNASIKVGSITTGQQIFWKRKEAEKYNQKDYRGTGLKKVFYQPFGDPGPGTIATVQHWTPKTNIGTFKWERERQVWKRWGPHTPVPVSIHVPSTELLHINAYSVGDYKQFFADPRTRMDYIQWAPLMLAAEDYLVGKIRK